jgi:hypothetical protein
VDYQVVYTITQQPFDWEFLASGIFFTVIGAFLLLAARPVSTITRRSLTYVRVFGTIFFTFALCWTGIVGVSSTTCSICGRM